MCLTECLSASRLTELLQRAQTARVGVMGDLALDGYWTADMTRSLLSRETPRFPRPIVNERYAPGAGGNVAQNLSALGVAEVHAFRCWERTGVARSCGVSWRPGRGGGLVLPVGATQHADLYRRCLWGTRHSKRIAPRLREP